MNKGFLKYHLVLTSILRTELPNFFVSTDRNMVKKYKDYRFRSLFERDFARDLEERNIDYEYETKKLSWIPKPRVYTPDFYLPDYDIYIETKGRFTSSDRVKHLRVADQHPDIDLRFVFMTPFNRLSRSSKTTYGDWCSKNGFTFSKERIPKEWIKKKKK